MKVAQIGILSTNHGVYSPDAAHVPISNWLGFDGFLNYIKYGDILDSTLAAASAYFEIEFYIRNYDLSRTDRLFSKFFTTGDQRQIAINKVGNDLQFIWCRTGVSTETRSVLFADCLSDTNEHKITFKYDGSINTNNGLDRVTLFIDDVQITSGKTLSVNLGTLGDIFNSTARLSFGVDVAGSGSTGTTLWYLGEAKQLVIRSSPSTVIFNGLDCPIGSNTTGTYTRLMNPVVDNTRNQSAQDTCQTTFNSIVDTGTEWYLYYLGSNPDINADRDITCLAVKSKGEDISTGWVKRLSGGLPEVIYSIGAGGKFDEKQSWLRNVRKKLDGTYEAFPVGQSGTDTFAMGYSTSPDGIVWTRQNSGNAVFSDGATGLTTPHVIYDDSDSKYKMIYAGNTLGESINYAESSSATSGWTKTISNILFGEGLGWPLAFQKIDGYYYIWAARKILFFSGISEEIVLYRSTDLLTFEYLGPQVKRGDACEFGITATIGIVKKPSGKYFMLHTRYKNQIGKAANLGEEFTCINASELNRADLPIASNPQFKSYPSYVKRHWPLSKEERSGLDFNESVLGGIATINSTPIFTPISSFYGFRDLGFVSLTGSQTITSTNPGGLIGTDIAVKLRIQYVGSGTHELFRIGNDIIVTSVSGKLQVVLSADGTTETKKYISTTDFSKPAGMNYIDDHIYTGFTFIGGVLKLWNDFVEFATTKTNDGALTNVFDSGSNILIGQNATLRMRSVSLCSGITQQQFIDLEI